LLDWTKHSTWSLEKSFRVVSPKYGVDGRQVTGRKSLYFCLEFVSVSVKLNHKPYPWVLELDKGACCCMLLPIFFIFYTGGQHFSRHTPNLRKLVPMHHGIGYFLKRCCFTSSVILGNIIKWCWTSGKRKNRLHVYLLFNDTSEFVFISLDFQRL